MSKGLKFSVTSILLVVGAYFLLSYYTANKLKDTINNAVILIDKSNNNNFRIQLQSYNQGILSSSANIIMQHKKFGKLYFNLQIKHQPFIFSSNSKMYIMKSVIYPSLSVEQKGGEKNIAQVVNVVESIEIDLLNQNRVVINPGDAYSNFINRSLVCEIYYNLGEQKAKCTSNIDMPQSDIISYRQVLAALDFTLGAGDKTGSKSLTGLDLKIAAASTNINLGSLANFRESSLSGIEGKIKNNIAVNLPSDIVRVNITSPTLGLSLDSNIVDLFVTTLLSNNKILLLSEFKDLKAQVKFNANLISVMTKAQSVINFEQVYNQFDIDNTNQQHTLNISSNISNVEFVNNSKFMSQRVLLNQIGFKYKHKFNSYDVLAEISKAMMTGKLDFDIDLQLGLKDYNHYFNNKSIVKFSNIQFNNSLLNDSDTPDNKLLSSRFVIDNISSNYQSPMISIISNNAKISMMSMVNANQCLTAILANNYDSCHYAYIVDAQVPTINANGIAQLQLNSLNFKAEAESNQKNTGFINFDFLLKSFLVKSKISNDYLALYNLKSVGDYKQSYKYIYTGKSMSGVDKFALNSFMLDKFSTKSITAIEQNIVNNAYDINIDSMQYQNMHYGSFNWKGRLSDITTKDYNRLMAPEYTSFNIFANALMFQQKGLRIAGQNIDDLVFEQYNRLIDKYSVNLKFKNDFAIGLEEEDTLKSITLNSLLSLSNLGTTNKQIDDSIFGEFKNPQAAKNRNTNDKIKAYDSIILQKSEDILSNISFDNTITIYEPYIKKILSGIRDNNVTAMYDILKKMGLLIYGSNQRATINITYKHPDLLINNNTWQQWQQLFFNTVYGQQAQSGRNYSYIPGYDKPTSDFKDKKQDLPEAEASKFDIKFLAMEANHQWQCEPNQKLISLKKDGKILSFSYSTWQTKYISSATDIESKITSSFCVEPVGDNKYKIQARSTNIYINTNYLSKDAGAFNATRSMAGEFTIIGVP